MAGEALRILPPNTTLGSDSLRVAIARATGVSRGTAHDIPALLMNGRLGGLTPLEVARPTLVGTAMFDGRRCYRVAENSPEELDPHATIWIEQDTLLIRKIEMAPRLGPMTFRTEREYRPVVEPF